MGASGRYGGRFALRSVLSAVDGAVVYDGAARRILRPPVEWRGGEDQPARRIQLDFQTPLRMRTEGQYNTSPNFTQIAQALLRRLSLLGAIYGASAAEGNDWLHRLMAQVDQVRTESAEFHVYHWDRMSGRLGRRVQMDGVMGSVRVSGDLTELAPWFRLGEWVHVGSGTSMGMGKYRMLLNGGAK
jgi:CRISPR-associated endoribonuclease Cas6